MAVKLYRPISPARRGMTTRDSSEITKRTPQKSLVQSKRTGSGRNNDGRITVRHRGGGVKRFYRLVDFKAQAEGEAKVVGIEYDPNRSAHVALVENAAGERNYILAGIGMKVGTT